MPNAFVKFRQGGGYQQVENYDYVLDYRKFIENGYYRDSGFQPMVLPLESTVINVKDELSAMAVGNGAYGQYLSGTVAAFDTAYPSSAITLRTQIPDEVTHTAPRQLSWYDTVLTFLSDTTQSEQIVGAADSTGFTRITVTNALLYSGKIVTFSGPDLPSALYPNELYYATAASALHLLLQKVVGGDFVPWGDAGTATSTFITVVDRIAEFPWGNILGWSNTAPTR